MKKPKVFVSMPVLMLIVWSLAAGVFAWLGKEKIVRLQFEGKTHEMTNIISRKFHTSLTFLYAARSLFEAHPELSAQQWRVFVRSQDLSSRIRGLVSAEYIIKNEDAYVLTYVEPFQENQSHIGFDLAADKQLRYTIQRAVRVDAAEISAPLRDSEQKQNAQDILRIFLPIYETDHTNIEAPHPPSQVKSLVGISLSADFFEDVRDFQHLNPGIDFEVYDASLGVNREGIVYHGDHEPYALNKKSNARFNRVVELAVPGRSWKIYFSAVNFRVKLWVEMLPFFVAGICFLFGLIMLNYHHGRSIKILGVEQSGNQKIENSETLFRQAS